MAEVFSLQESDGVAVLTFDVPESKVNTLSTPNLGQLGEVVGRLATRTDLHGLLLKSGKPGQFIAGADLKELAALAVISAERASVGLEAGHKLFSAISELPFPTVALIDGPCMGGGAELVLAMDYRLASTNPKTQISLPETNIGIIPAWGGTQRLPRLIGVPNAINMICSGETVRSQRAVELGLVFDAVDARDLEQQGRRLIEYARESGEWKELRKRRSQPVGLSEDQLTFAAGTAKGFILNKTKGHYPAPLVALEAITKGCNLPLEQGLEVEKKTALQVVGSPISANLIGVFFMTQRLERDPGVQDKSIGPEPVNSVGVLGAGVMGAGIATAHARSGIPAEMVDVDPDRVAGGMRRAQEVVASRIKIGRATPEDMASMLSLLNTSTSLKAFSDCDVVIEAVTENEKVKTEVYRQLADVVKPNAIWASNTSTISISRLAEASPDPARFVGMHFFNPVDRMQLVEVIRGERTSDQTVATTVALAKRVRKKPIVVNDCPGFLVNRILFPYMNESLQLLIEGASIDAIDKAATAFGMPMGPILLHDVVGLDVGLYAGAVMAAAYPDRSLSSTLLEEMVQQGRWGQKNGRGFRSYPKGKKKGAPDPDFEALLAKHRTETRDVGAEEITERLFLPMLLEATRCLEDQIVRQPADVDMGLILGIGFPPFRGGILRWCDHEKPDRILTLCQKYESLGKRFEPTAVLKDHAQAGKLFYPIPKSAAAFGG